MIRRFTFIAAILLFIFYGCGPVKRSQWRDYNRKTSNFVQSADIKAGEKLKKEHKDESFIYNNYIMEIGFNKNPDYEEWIKKSKEKKKKYTKLKWVDNRVNYTIDVNDELTDSEVKELKIWYQNKYKERYTYPYIQVTDEDVAEHIEEIKRNRNSTPPGQYMSSIKHSFELTSLEDYNSYGLTVAYTNGSSIKDLTVDYGRGTYEPDHAIVPYESNGIFYQDVNIYAANVYFPTLGSRAYVDYTEDYNDIKFNTTVYIPEEYFQEKKTISFAIPAWLDVTIIEKNFEGLDFTKTTSAPKPIKKKVVKNVGEDGTTTSVDADAEPASNSKTNSKSKSKTKDKKAKAAAGVKYITYEFKNVKPRDYKNDKSSRGQSYNYPHFLIQYNYATEGTEQKPLTGTTTGLYNWYRELVKQLKNDTAALSKITHKLIEDKPTDDEKIKSIYYWVQDNIRYIAFEDGIAGFKPEECSEVFNNRYGDCKGMANLLVNMLHIAGYDARRVWIGTRHLNYDYSTPSIAVNNHMIAALKRDTGFIFLDGTETWCPFNQYAHRIQGRQVMIENGDTFLLYNIPEYGPDFNLENVAISASISGKEIKASTEKTYNGESRLNFIRQVNDLELQDREKALYNYVSNRNIDLKPSNIKTSDIRNREGKATLSYNLDISNHIIESNGKKYVNIDWERDLQHLEFDTAKRSDFDFGEKICQKMEVKLDLGNLKVDYMPANINVNNEFYKIHMGLAVQGNTLVYKREIIIKQGYIPVSELKNWNDLHAKMNSFYNDYIILK